MQHRVIITGFGAGLSAELATRLLKRGHLVAGISRSGAFGSELKSRFSGWRSYTADVSDRAALQRAIGDFTEQCGAPSVLIHNAAELIIGDFLELRAEDFERSWRTGCLGAFHAAQLVLPAMLEAGAGALIFSGATASVKGGAKFGAFAPAKFALRGLAQSLARAYGPRGVHVAHVVIDGVIWGERAAKRFGMTPEACMDPGEIAESYLALLDQKPSSWTHELDLRPAGERF